MVLSTYISERRPNRSLHTFEPLDQEMPRALILPLSNREGLPITLPLLQHYESDGPNIEEITGRGPTQEFRV